MSFLDKAKDLVETAHEKLAPEAVGKAADVAEKVDRATRQISRSDRGCE